MTTPPLVFITGMQCTADSVTEMQQELAVQHGVNTSVFTATEPGLEATVAALAATLVQPAILVGHSLGGTIALACARLFPEKVAGLVLICTNPDAPRPDQYTTWEQMRTKVAAGRLGSVIAQISPLLLAGESWANPVHQEQVAVRCEQMMFTTGPVNFTNQLTIQAERCDELPALASFKHPVLAIAAEHDALVATGAVRSIAAQAANGQFYELPNASHMAPMTQPAHVTAVISQWLTQNFALQTTQEKVLS